MKMHYNKVLHYQPAQDSVLCQKQQPKLLVEHEVYFKYTFQDLPYSCSPRVAHYKKEGTNFPLEKGVYHLARSSRVLQTASKVLHPVTADLQKPAL